LSPDPAALGRFLAKSVKALIAPIQADLATTKAALAATETALAVLQATIAQGEGAKAAAALERRLEALLADVGTVREKVAAVEVKTLQPGPPGPPGKDGVGFDDLDCVDDGTGVVLQFRRGTDIKSFPLSIPYDRGTYKADETYAKGNCVNDGGYWTAKAATKGIRPGTSPQAWRLLVHPKSYKS
jgi:hypothetical protein